MAGQSYQPIQTKKYKLMIKDLAGNWYKLNLLGMDRISSTPGKVNVDIAYDLFPHVPKGILERGTHEVGLLIGQDYVSMLPTGGDGYNQVENLRVMNMKFGRNHGAARRTERLRCSHEICAHSVEGNASSSGQNHDDWRRRSYNQCVRKPYCQSVSIFCKSYCGG